MFWKLLKKSHSYLICIWLSWWKHCYKTYLDPANKKTPTAWRDLYEITLIPFTICDKATNASDKSISGYWYYSGKIKNS